jgi:hypothetical protein
VVSASLLEPGRSYGEDELRDAVHRVARLPFVLAADFALERGSERGAYELVIAVVETRRFFFAAERRFTTFGRKVTLERDPQTGSDYEQFARGTIGFRQRLGAYGEAFVALDTERGFQGGLTHYNLFGRHATGSVAVSETPDLCCTAAVFPLGLDPALSGWSLDESRQVAARLTVPLAGNHALRFAGESLRGAGGFRRGLLTPDERFFDDREEIGSFEHLRAEVSWLFDDSDDPLAPRSGRTLAAGIEGLSLDGRLEAPLFDPTPEAPGPGRYRGELLRAVASGAVHRPLTPRQAVTLSGRLAAGRGRAEGVAAGAARLPEEDYTGVQAAVAVIHRATLWRPPEAFAELWLETEAGYGYEEISPGLPGAVAALGQGHFGVQLVWRNAWGVFRAGWSFVGLEETRR